MADMMDAAKRWLAGQGPDPFVSTPMDYSNYSSMLPPPSDMDELGTIDYAKDSANYTQDVNDIISDPAFITQMSVGGGIGGWQPADFEPTIKWEPVKAPGYQRINFLKGSGDPVQEYLAERMGEQQGTAYSAITELKQLYRTGAGGDPQLQAIINQLEADQYIDNSGQQVPNFQNIEKMANDLEKLIIADPQFNGIDPNTGLPANVVDAETGQMRADYRTNPETGQLERKVESPTEAMEYFERVGLPNPYETYNPDVLASTPQLMREDRQGVANLSDQNYLQSSGELNELGAAYKEQLGANDIITQMMRQFNRDQKIKQNDVATAMMGPQFDREGWVDGKDEREAVLGGGAGSLSMQGGAASPEAMRTQDVFDRSRKSADAQNRAMARMAGPRDRGPLANNRDAPERVAFRKSMNDAAAARNQASKNFAEQRMREQMMRRITAAGHTPFNDRMNARQRNVIGF